MLPYKRLAIIITIPLLIAAGALFVHAQFSGVPLTASPLLSSGSYAAASGTSLKVTATWIKSVGYFVMFVAMLVEGPIITAAAAFGAALGYFNVWLVFLLSILGDFVADLVYYAVGYFGRVSVVEKFGHKFGLSNQRMQKIERLLNTHPIKTLVFIKFTPVLPTPGLMIVGLTRMSIKRYTLLSILIILPKAVLFMVVGYYFGAAYGTITHYTQAGEYFLIVAVAVIVGVYWIYQKGTTIVSRRLGREEGL